jgi:hypothetical protein
MGWFARWKRRVRNYTSAGDYPGARGGGGHGSEADARATTDTRVTEVRDTRGPSGPIA